MTATLILETLAKEFSVRIEAVQSVFEMIDAGLSSPFIGRFRRAQTECLSESQVRRLQTRRLELEELDRRRGTMLRTLERADGVEDPAARLITKCTDRFEIEDLFVPHRRPEPEVQLAVDRGLGHLADLLVKPMPKAERRADAGPEAESSGAASTEDQAPGDSGDPSAAASTESAAEPTAESPAADADGAAGAEPESAAPGSSESGGTAPEAVPAPEAAPAVETAPAPAVEAPRSQDGAEAAPSPERDAHAAGAGGDVSYVGGVPAKIVITPELARICAPFVNPDKGIHTESEALAGAVRILSDRLGRNSQLRGLVRRMLRKRGVLHVRPLVDDSKAGRHRSLFKMKQPLRQVQGHRLIALRQAQKERVLNTAIVLDPDVALAKVRAALGRHTDPACEGLLVEVARQALEARLLPQAEADVRLELKERGDAEALRFLSQHLRQVLLTPTLAPQPVAAIDVNARGDWVVCVLDAHGVPVGVKKIDTREAAAPAPAPAEAAAPVAAEAPAEVPSPAADPAPADPAPADPAPADPAPADPVPQAEAGTEPAAETPPAAGLDVQLGDSAPAAAQPQPEAPAGGEAPAAKDAASAAPAGRRARAKKARPAPPKRKDAATLGAELAEALGEHGAHALGVGHGKGPRAAVPLIREAIAAAGLDVCVTVVNESGLSSYANSELGRRELSGHSVPERMAISLGRRLQDPMAEIVKIDPRHLGLGSEQGLVSKANLRRMFQETVESCVAHVGCDVNHAPLSILSHIPGLDEAVAQKIIDARTARPFQDREELRAEGMLSEAQWTSSIAFLRVRGGGNPLDGTALHPEMYDLATQLLDSVGGSVQESLGRPAVTKGLRRASYEVDEATWRDLMRELSQPGRDPRPRLFRPELLDPATDRARLMVGRVVEGIVTNVASFGAFVEIGLPQDAMVHISEMSSRYVRDARELLSIGQTLRAKILDPNGQRISLSLKDVGDPRRPAPGARRPEKRSSEERGRGPQRRGRREERGPKVNPNLRAAQERRDGIGARSSRGNRPGGGRGAGGRGGDSRRRQDDRGERVNLKTINAQANQGTTYSPFASFFKGRDGEEDPTPKGNPPAPRDTSPPVEQARPEAAESAPKEAPPTPSDKDAVEGGSSKSE